MSNELNIEQLLKALDNEDNASVIQLNYEKIAANKNDILQKLHLPKEQLKNLIKTVKTYRHVDTLDELRYGSYMRWISLKKSVSPADIKLTNGGILCHMKQVDNNIHLVCKTKMGFLIQLNMSENIIFQKLNDEEMIILSALKFLDA
jgi:hypothetical protein